MKLVTMVKIKLHSLIDLITNSSTEIFVNSENSLEACKNLVNEFLKTVDSTLTCDDMFKLSIEMEECTVVDYREYIQYEYEDDEDLGEKLQMFDQYVKGKIEEPDWWEGDRIQSFLVIKPKDKKYKKLAELFKEFLYSPEYYEYSN